MSATYVIDYIQGNKFILCRTCGNRSFAPADIENRYCGFCRKFHDDPPTVPVASEDQPQNAPKT